MRAMRFSIQIVKLKELRWSIRWRRIPVSENVIFVINTERSSNCSAAIIPRSPDKSQTRRNEIPVDIIVDARNFFTGGFEIPDLRNGGRSHFQSIVIRNRAGAAIKAQPQIESEAII